MLLIPLLPKAWSSKRRIPHTTNYEPLLDLVRFLGIDIKSKICIARNATYTSDKPIQEIVYVISEINILEQMRKTEHFALMLDETADCTVTELLAIHARFTDASSGEAKSQQLDLLQPESAEQDRMNCLTYTGLCCSDETAHEENAGNWHKWCSNNDW